MYDFVFLLNFYSIAEEEKTVIGETSPRVEEAPPKPLAELSMEEVEEWLSRIGLESYAPELRRWGATGTKLLDATQNQIEKELDIKNSMHRKKLLYAVESERCNGVGFLGSEKVIFFFFLNSIWAQRVLLDFLPAP